MRKVVKRGRRVSRRNPRGPTMGTIRPLQFNTKSMSTKTITAFGTQVVSFTYGQLLTDIKTTGSFHRQVKLAAVTVRFAPLSASNTAATFATAIPGCSAALSWVDPTISSGSTTVLLSDYKQLSTTNQVRISGRPPTVGSGWEQSDDTTIALAIFFAVPNFSTSYNVQFYIECTWLMARDESINNI